MTKEQELKRRRNDIDLGRGGVMTAALILFTLAVGWALLEQRGKRQRHPVEQLSDDQEFGVLLLLNGLPVPAPTSGGPLPWYGTPYAQLIPSAGRNPAGGLAGVVGLWSPQFSDRSLWAPLVLAVLWRQLPSWLRPVRVSVSYTTLIQQIRSGCAVPTRTTVRMQVRPT